jgi:hypothetical protein
LPISQELYDAILIGFAVVVFFCFVGIFFTPEAKETYEDLRRIYKEIKAAKAEKESGE